MKKTQGWYKCWQIVRLDATRPLSPICFKRQAHLSVPILTTYTCPKCEACATNTYPDYIVPYEQADLGLHCLQKPHLPLTLIKTQGKGNWCLIIINNCMFHNVHTLQPEYWYAELQMFFFFFTYSRTVVHWWLVNHSYFWLFLECLGKSHSCRSRRI